MGVSTSRERRENQHTTMKRWPESEKYVTLDVRCRCQREDNFMQQEVRTAEGLPEVIMGDRPR